MASVSTNVTRTPADALRVLRNELLSRRDGGVHWTGRLSDSVLATATAVSALAQYRKHALWPIISRLRLDELIDKGIRWTVARQNDDGGWGDAPCCLSNIATTMLVRAALELSDVSSAEIVEADRRAEYWCAKKAIPDPRDSARGAEGVVAAVRARYGADKTFAVPILANCAIAGLVPWSSVAALPFEAAMVPQSVYRFIRLPVVSYAIPALVAIGQARFLNGPPRNPVTRLVRRLSIRGGMRLLEKMQPASGGFLEATPLTSFVAMSLAHTGRADHPVTRNCIQFIVNSFRDFGDEGTWPIDTNLATWNTTLSINALGDQEPDEPDFLSDELLQWLLSCQQSARHPYTGAAPGGWGWSNLSGAVPDADDTAGALLALRHWWNREDLAGDNRRKIHQAAASGVDWLLGLQNRDRGWPTFCKGWGRLPFDRSGADITAHVLRALIAWQADVAEAGQIAAAVSRGLKFLTSTQHQEGFWAPLWFGNQDREGEENPVYGTARVLAAWRDARRLDDSAARRGLQWLIENQNRDGGWGGGPSRPATIPGVSPMENDLNDRLSSFQETALAVDLLASCRERGDGGDLIDEVLARGLEWLLEGIERKENHERWPIGFYFARLWYHEALYPAIFATSALRSIAACETPTDRTPN